MNKALSLIDEIQSELNALSEKKTLTQVQRVVLSVIRLLDKSIALDNKNLFNLFTDSDGKIRANASWFYEDEVMVDRKATYKVHSDNNLNIDFKFYGIIKPGKRTISWSQALTPNFEDEPFNTKFNVGIDFVVPKTFDRVIIVLSSNYVVRTLELKGTLTATYQEILAKWTGIEDFNNKKQLHNILWESFDLQPLNKKFYAGISERFINLRQHLIGEKILDAKHASMFANRLIGRVIFCWFLDKKGIINPEAQYFNSDAYSEDTKYYRDKLEKLFFNVLNSPIDERSVDDKATPFLNGGLFEARENDLYQNSKLTFPKNYFDDLFAFLSAYNFTTDESTSQFQQVAIDPEMLGRIFENLLAEITEETGEQARKAKGAFYTPREIVDYMCKESLKEYLKTKIKEDEFRDQRLYQLIDAPDKDFQDQDHNWRRDWKPYKEAIIGALDELKVLDPACGSGAFPIGMMQLLVKVYERLETRFDSYKTKLGIIEKNIYGVDIEPMAVEISRLRAWLSIIVDEEADSKKIKPLPNLEFKFVCANSLIDLDQSGAHALGEDPDFDKKLREIRDAYFNTESLNKKKKLRKDYESLVNKQEGLFGESKKSKQLKTYHPFDSELSASFFNSEFMFGVEGFNILIANPPYVTTKYGKIDEDTKRLYSQTFESAYDKLDLYVLFIEKGIRLAQENGIITYITPWNFLGNLYSFKIRKYILDNTKIKLFNKLPPKTFESAIVDNIIFLLEKNKNNQNNQIIFDDLFDKTKRQVVNQNKYLNNDKYIFSFPGDETSAGILKKMEKDSVKLGDIALNYIGIMTGGQKEMIADAPVFPNSKKVLSGKEISKWMINYNNNYVNFDRKKIHSNDNESVYLAPKKILLRKTGRELVACLDTNQYYTIQSLYNIVIKDKSYDEMYILILLNSKLFTYIYNKFFITNPEVFPYIKRRHLDLFPIRKSSDVDQKIFENLGKQIINLKNSGEDVSQLEIEANELVMNTYGLTDNEKEIVRAFII